jgi:DNA-directed RNA polymerase specialized sigma subunit
MLNHVELLRMKQRLAVSFYVELLLNFIEVIFLTEILKNYRHIMNEINHIKEEIELLKIQSVSPRSPIISDMPKGSPIENDKMAALMIKFEELEEKYQMLLNELLEKQHQIECLIEKLEPFERELIRYRYVDGLPWFKVQKKLNVSQRTAFRMHEKILNKMEKMAHSGT